MICDAQQISQTIINLLQNSIDALINHYKLEETPLPQSPTAQVNLSLKRSKDQILLIIEDNGPGFPKEGRERLIEPYYTTREKGTGLGLAIVAKIVEDHHGWIELGDSSLGGARVTLRFNLENSHSIKKEE
jgi:two-component system nitrogen regulation sensor histidine kinase NtrY